jgi:hypothetical protein
MASAFVDTTVLTDALLKVGPVGIAARDALKRYDRTLLPVYALKEFKAGPLSYYIYLHNKFASEPLYSSVVKAIHGMSRTPKRNIVSTALEEMAGLSKALGKKTFAELQSTYGGDMTVDKWQSDACRMALRVKIMKAWGKRRSITSAVVYPLSCYTEGAVTENRGLLETNGIRCSSETGCAVHAFFANDIPSVRAMRDVCEPLKRDEDVRRYRVLREIARVPKRSISDQDCRRLGDAVFALLAPADAEILTTNLKDHEPLAAALGKSAARP